MNIDFVALEEACAAACPMCKGGMHVTSPEAFVFAHVGLYDGRPIALPCLAQGIRNLRANTKDVEMLSISAHKAKP